MLGQGVAHGLRGPGEIGRQSTVHGDLAGQGLGQDVVRLRHHLAHALRQRRGLDLGEHLRLGGHPILAGAELRLRRLLRRQHVDLAGTQRRGQGLTCTCGGLRRAAGILAVQRQPGAVDHHRFDGGDVTVLDARPVPRGMERVAEQGPVDVHRRRRLALGHAERGAHLLRDLRDRRGPRVETLAIDAQRRIPRADQNDPVLPRVPHHAGDDGLVVIQLQQRRRSGEDLQRRRRPRRRPRPLLPQRRASPRRRHHGRQLPQRRILRRTIHHGGDLRPQLGFVGGRRGRRAVVKHLHRPRRPQRALHARDLRRIGDRDPIRVHGQPRHHDDAHDDGERGDGQHPPDGAAHGAPPTATATATTKLEPL